MANGQLEVNPGGTATFKAKNRGANDNRPAVVVFDAAQPLLKNLGTVDMTDRSMIEFKVDNPQTNTGQGGGFGQPEPNALQDPPVLKMAAGCSIKCHEKTAVRITGGSMMLTERRDASGAPEATQDPISISSASVRAQPQLPLYTLDLAAGTILGREDNTPKAPLKLEITSGDTSLRCAGTIRMYAEKGAPNGDLITTDKQVEFKDTTLIDMYWFAATANAALPAMPVAWTLVKSTYGGMGDAINITPEFSGAPVGANEEITLVREGAK